MSEPTTGVNHPAQVLREHAEKMTRSISATPPQRMATFHAADILSAYEKDHHVTFLAVGNDDLAALIEAQGNAIDRSGAISTARTSALVIAVANLLGLN